MKVKLLAGRNPTDTEYEFTCYCPVFDIVACGETRDEAKRKIKLEIQHMIDFCQTHKKCYKDLARIPFEVRTKMEGFLKEEIFMEL